MKRVLALFLCAAVLLLCAACGKGPAAAPGVVSPDDADDDIVVTAAPDTTAPTISNKTVKVTVPLALVSEAYREDPENYVATRNILSVKEHPARQTVTFEMSAVTQHLLLAEIGIDVTLAVYRVQESGEYPWVKRIVSLDQEDFAEVVLAVDKEGYLADRDPDFVPFYLASNCFLYQAYTTKNRYRCTVTLQDEITGETVFQQTYKEHN